MADLDVDLAELLLAALNGAGGHRLAARSFTTFLLQQLRRDDSFTEQNSGFVTTTGHQATRYQAVFATWDVEQ